jgi:hypothetical protein
VSAFVLVCHSYLLVLRRNPSIDMNTTVVDKNHFGEIEMRIIKKGKIPPVPTHKCTCGHCRTEFECTENECSVENESAMYSPTVKTNLVINCPLCGKSVVVVSSIKRFIPDKYKIMFKS